MPRTKEQLEEILKDLQEISKVAVKLNKRGAFFNTPLNGVSPSDEKKAFYQPFVDEWQRLLDENLVTSCEGIVFARDGVNRWEKVRDKNYNILLLPRRHNMPSEMKAENGVAIPELIEGIKKILSGNKHPEIINEVEETLNTISNCNIVSNDLLLNEAKEIALKIENLTAFEIAVFRTRNELLSRV